MLRPREDSENQGLELCCVAQTCSIRCRNGKEAAVWRAAATKASTEYYTPDSAPAAEEDDDAGEAWPCWLTAAAPYGLQLQSIWRIPAAAVSVAYSCSPCGESLLRL